MSYDHPVYLASGPCVDITWPGFGSVTVSDNVVRDAIRTVLNAARDYLKLSDIQGAWLEARGHQTEAERVTGKAFQHAKTEVPNAIHGMKLALDRLKTRSSDMRLSASDRAVARAFVRMVSKTLDYIEKVLNSDEFPTDYKLPLEEPQTIPSDELFPDPFVEA